MQLPKNVKWCGEGSCVRLGAGIRIVLQLPRGHQQTRALAFNDLQR